MTPLQTYTSILVFSGAFPWTLLLSVWLTGTRPDEEFPLRFWLVWAILFLVSMIPFFDTILFFVGRVYGGGS